MSPELVVAVSLAVAVSGVLFIRAATTFMRMRCPHLNVRCTHGDEILWRGGRRRVCLDCGQSLDGPLPDPCSWTGEPHRG